MDFIVKWSNDKNVHLLQETKVTGKFRQVGGRVIRVEMDKQLQVGELISEDVTILDTCDEQVVKKNGKKYTNKIYHWE